LKERCGLEARTNFFSFKKVAKTRCGLDSRIYGISRWMLILFEILVPVWPVETLCEEAIFSGNKMTPLNCCTNNNETCCYNTGLYRTAAFLTIPMKAPFSVHMKFQLGAPPSPNRPATITMMLPPEPPITVLLITRAISSLSLGFVIVPRVPPLNARNPVIRIRPPTPVSWKENVKMDKTVTLRGWGKLWSNVPRFGLDTNT
jgi:hypothetical protein